MDTPQTEEERERSQKLMATMGALNEKMGKGTVRSGLPEKNARWHEMMVEYKDEGQEIA